DKEKVKVGNFLKHNALTFFPYEFPGEYNAANVEICADADGDKYVLFQGKRMYAKRGWTDDHIRGYFNFLTIEQDTRSPHCYFTNKERRPSEQDIVADIGVAEGNFSLSIIDHVKKIYLFEGDPDWLYSIRKTFAPWKDKVEIVPKFVGDCDNENETRLDSFFKDKQLDYIKADVEGAEPRLLKGGEETFSGKVKKVLLCAYHRKEHEGLIRNCLRSHNFEIAVNKGYMIFLLDKLSYPYIRRGVIYGRKSG
nr:FkbM family methyltransferase [Lachnospiraceae bacterium]